MKYIRKPDWLKIKLPEGDNFRKIRLYRHQKGLSTVCEEAHCPNLGECWKSGTATFMLLGDTCTRGCRFCSVGTARNLPPPDIDEPEKLVATLRDLSLKYVVLTTVNRDDLPDQGAGHIRRTIETISQNIPDLLIEILIPDFCGQQHLIDEVIHSNPLVIAHNVECTRELTAQVRDPRASYDQSLQVLSYIKEKSPHTYTKSSIMLGLGEEEESVLHTLRDLANCHVDIVTIGQYLQPDKAKLSVIEYIPPDRFHYYQQKAYELGFSHVSAGPLVRSSYKAAETFLVDHHSRRKKLTDKIPILT